MRILSQDLVQDLGRGSTAGTAGTPSKDQKGGRTFPGPFCPGRSRLEREHDKVTVHE
jgi:hypothetical protein